MSQEGLGEQEERIGALLRRSDGPIAVRPLRAASNPARPRSYGRVAAGTVGAALIVLAAALAGAGLNGRRQGVAAPPVPGCPVTELTSWHPTTGNFHDPYPVRVGDRLAGMPYLTYLGPGDYWYVRDQPKADSIDLVARRLDAAADPVPFRARGYPLGAGLPPDWVPGWYYRTDVDAPELTTGCWRVSPADDPESGVVYRLRFSVR